VYDRAAALAVIRTFPGISEDGIAGGHLAEEAGYLGAQDRSSHPVLVPLAPDQALQVLKDGRTVSRDKQVERTMSGHNETSIVCRVFHVATAESDVPSNDVETSVNTGALKEFF
jgi:hypothetical protein